MTAPKPETPATDALVDEWRNISAAAKEQHRESAICSDRWITLSIRMTQLDAFTARIAADAETNRKQAEEIERLKAQVQVGHDVIRDFDAKIDEARDQVRGLREALKLALDHCDCSDYRGMALIPCTEANPCAGCYTMRTGQSALAATEPKG